MKGKPAFRMMVFLALLLFAVAPGKLIAQEEVSGPLPQFVASFHAPADVLRPTGLQAADRKEPLVAGLLSWLFPGLGNFYAGNSGHGVRHVIIEVAGLGLLVAGAAQNTDPNSLEVQGGGLIIAGLVVVVVNGVWSIFSSIKDVETYNRRAAGGRPGAALDVGPVFRVLSGDDGAPRAGLEVVRLTF